MVMPQPFTTTSPVNTIFNWEDIIADIGYKTFLGLSNVEGNALVTSPIPSMNFKTIRTSTGTTEINFDHEFLASADIEGSGFFAATIEVEGGGSGSPETIRVDIRLIHVDLSSSETVLVPTIQSGTISQESATTSKRMSLTMTIPNTHFAIGEKMRLEVRMVTTRDNGSLTLYHDPANRGTPSDDAQTGESPRTDIQLVIPFRIPL